MSLKCKTHSAHMGSLVKENFCQWEFLVPIKVVKSNHGAGKKLSIRSLLVLNLSVSRGECICSSVCKLSQDPAKRPMKHLVGACTSLTAHNVSRRSRKRQCVCNLSGGCVCVCVWKCVMHICEFEHCLQPWEPHRVLIVFLYCQPPSVTPRTLVRLRRGGAQLGNKHRTNKQTGATAWRAALLIL